MLVDIILYTDDGKTFELPRMMAENWKVHASMEGTMFNLRGRGNGSERTERKHGAIEGRLLSMHEKFRVLNKYSMVKN